MRPYRLIFYFFKCYLDRVQSPRLTGFFYLINWVEPPNRNAALGIVRQGIVIGIPGQIDNIANIEFQFFLIK